MTDRMRTFLSLVSSANWRTPPRVWNEEFRSALNDGLVRVGWGGILVVTKEGAKQMLAVGEHTP